MLADERRPGVVCDRFTLDVAGHRLWRGETLVRLRPKAWSVLCHLVERAGELVTRESLHQAIWNGAAVSDDTLTQAVADLRRALGDSARAPRLIETVHRLGFRLLVQPRAADAAEPTSPPAAGAPATAGADLPDAAPISGAASSEPAAFVGREDELRRLEAMFDRARQGRRQLVLICGETGIGKTSVVEQFLAGLPAQGEASVLRGHCVQQYGQREPYMPVLEAIERQARAPQGRTLVRLMQRITPRVYALLTTLHAEGDGATASTAAPPPSYDRVLRELAALLEAVAARSCLVLVLEDLHWSDEATMDLVSVLAQRPDPARILIIGTYRPAEAALQAHPIRDLRHWLRAHRRHAHLDLGYLSVDDVEAYLHRRFAWSDPRLARSIHHRTDGNPLFVVLVVDQLVRQGGLRRVRGRWVASVPNDLTVPDDVRDVIADQLRNVDPGDRPLLEAASVAGVRFDPKVVAGALARDHEAVEAACDRLARAHLFLQLPVDGEDAADPLYEFTHALQQQVIYEQIPELRRRRLHRAIASELEARRGDHAADRAPELSMHYERAGLLSRAVEHLARCVGRAQQRGAHRQAAAYVDQALRLLHRLPAGAERERRELALRLSLGISLNVTHGYTSPAVVENNDRARALCERAGDDRQLFEVVSAIWYLQLGQRDVTAARDNVDVLARIADRLGDRELRRRAEATRGRTEFWHGRFPAAVALLGRFLDEVRADEAAHVTPRYGVAPLVAARFQRGLALWFVGYPDQARAHARAGLAAHDLHGAPFDSASSYCQAALLATVIRDLPATKANAERCLAICRDHDVGFFRSMAAFLVAAAAGRPDQRRLRAMSDALAEHRTLIGSFLSDVMLSSIAALCGRLRRWDEGLRHVEDGIALTRTSLERIYEAELWRLRGELLIGRARDRATARTPRTAAQESFARSLEIADDQGARSLALRTRMSLARHTPTPEAVDELQRLYESFTEGFETPDLLEAKAMLARIGRV